VYEPQSQKAPASKMYDLAMFDVDGTVIPAFRINAARRGPSSPLYRSFAAVCGFVQCG
jgi:hypothetical protein